MTNSVLGPDLKRSNKGDEEVKIRVIAEHSTRRSYHMPSRSFVGGELSTELY